MRSNSLFVITLIMLVSITGCGGSSERSLETYIKEVKSRNSFRVDALPQPKPYERFAYPKNHMRNPFVRVVEQTQLKNSPDLSRPKQPLEAFALDSLRMVGTVTQEHRLWAVIAAPDGVVYRVTKGQFLGQNFGKIKEITSKETVVEEAVQTEGGWEARPSKLALSEGDQ